MIKEKYGNETFAFSHVLPEDVKMEINKLQTSKKSRGKIPISIIKMLAEVNLHRLTDCIKQLCIRRKISRRLEVRRYYCCIQSR